MRNLFLAFFTFLTLSVGAQTNVIYFKVGDILSGAGSPNLKGIKTVLTDTTENPRIINGVMISPTPKNTLSQNDGKAYFTNVVWGTYSFTIYGSPVSSFDIQVETNTTGIVDGATLTSITNQPNPLSEFYTKAQVDALFSDFTVGVSLDQLLSTSNALQTQITSGGVTELVATNISQSISDTSSNKVYGNAVTQINTTSNTLFGAISTLGANLTNDVNTTSNTLAGTFQTIANTTSNLVYGNTVSQINTTSNTIIGHTVTIAGTANQITSSTSSAQTLGANPSATLSLPSTIITPGTLNVSGAQTNQSTLSVTGNQTNFGNAYFQGTLNGSGANLTSLTAANLTGIIPHGSLPSFSLTNGWTGTFSATNVTVPGTISAGTFSGNGSGLTSLSAAQLTGTVPTARLGSGTANNTTYLRGDQTWATPPGGGGLSSLTMTNVYTNDLSASSTDWQLLNVTGVYTNSETTLVAGSTSACLVLTNHYTAANDFAVTFRMFMYPGASAGFGIRAGVGTRGTQAEPNDLFWQLDASGATNAVNWWHLVSGTTTFTLDTATYRTFGYAQFASFSNAWLDVSYVQLHGSARLTISNETTGKVLRGNFGQTALGGSPYYYFGGSGYPTIWLPTGAAKFREFSYSLIKPSSYSFLAVGDSIGVGFSSGTASGSWPKYAADELKTECVVYGREGDATEHLLLCTNEIAALTPPLILNAIGGNDGSLKSDSDTFLAAVKSIAATVDITPTPRYGAFATPTYLRDWMVTNGTEYVDLYSSFVTNASTTILPQYQADAPHPNDEGLRIAGTIVASYLRMRAFP